MAREKFLQSFPEGGYGWLVVLSTFLVNFVVFGYAFTWGVYQALYLADVYKGQITTFQLTFVGGLTTALLFALGPFFSALNQLLGFRLLMCAGAILQPLGLLLASWAHSPWQLYLTHGVLVGIGSALIFFPSVFLPTQWFLRRRGLATGISVAGSGIGGLVFGPLTRALIDMVGFRWCLRCVAIGNFVILTIAILLTRECEATKRPLDAISAVSQTKRRIVDLSLLKRADFAALAMMATLVTFGYLAPLYLLPSYATFIGLTASDGALFVGLSSGINAIGRISLGFAADRLGVVNMLFVCAFFPGMTILLVWTFATSYGTLLLFVLMYGIFAGGLFTLFPVVTAELVGLEKLPNAIGVLYAANAIGNLFGPTIAGALLDSTHPSTSYLPVQLFCGIVTVIGSMFIVWLRMMRTRKWFARV